MMSSSNEELLDALKIAFCYMPELRDLTVKNYAGILPTVIREVSHIRKVLKDNGIDPDVTYETMNPIIKSKKNDHNEK
jgi:hypothetical protein